MIRDPELTIFLIVYWFAGGYILALVTPYAWQCGVGGVLFGLVMLLIMWRFEDQGYKPPGIVVYLAFFPPPTMALFGLALWIVLRLS